jgi:hypothetical protein
MLTLVALPHELVALQEDSSYPTIYLARVHVHKGRAVEVRYGQYRRGREGALEVSERRLLLWPPGCLDVYSFLAEALHTLE